MQKILKFWKGLPREVKVFSAAFLVLLIIFVGPRAVNQTLHIDTRSAEFYFSGVPESVAIGQNLPLELRVHTTGTAINAIGLTLSFNPAYLEITNMTSEKSFCTLYTENSFNAVLGEAHLSCGVPQPGFQGDSLAVRLTLRAKIAGIVPITLRDGSILANDGKGSNIMKGTPTARVQIQAF